MLCLFEKYRHFYKNTISIFVALTIIASVFSPLMSSGLDIFVSAENSEDVAFNATFDTDAAGWGGEYVYCENGGENDSGCVKPNKWGSVSKWRVPLKANTTYTYSFYVGGDGGAARFYIQLENPFSATETYLWSSSNTTQGFVYGEFTTTTEAEYILFLREWGGANLVTYDSFKIVEGGLEDNGGTIEPENPDVPDEPEEPEDSGLTGEVAFEATFDENADGWGGEYVYCENGGEYNSGCVKPNAWGSVSKWRVLLKANTTYTYSFYVGGDGGAARFYIQLENPFSATETYLWSSSNTTKGIVQGRFTTTTEAEYILLLREWGGANLVTYDSFYLIEGTDTSVLPNKMPPPQVTDYHTKASFLSNNSNNMLGNSDFESMPQSGTSWNVKGFSDNASFSIDTTEKYSGNKSLKFTGYDEESEISLRFSAEAQTEYTFGAWVKGGYLSTQYPGSVKFGVVDNEGNFANFSENANTHTSNESYLTCFARDMKWHRVGFKFKTTEANEFVFVIRGKNAQMWFDDIVIAKSSVCVKQITVSPTAPKGAWLQIISNPSCNQSDNIMKEISLSNAEYWADKNICRSAVKVSRDPRNSANEVLLYEPSEYNVSNSYYSRVINVKKNTDYVFSAFYRSDVKSSANFGLYYKTDNSSPVLYSVSSSDVGSWKFVKYKFNTNDYDKVTFFIQDKGGNLILDDIELFEASKGISLDSSSKLNEMNSALSGRVSSAPTGGTNVSNYASRKNYNVGNWAADSAELTALLEADTGYVWSFNVKNSNSTESFKLTIGGETAYYGKATNGIKTGLLKIGKTAPNGNFAEFSVLDDGGEYSISDFTVTKLMVGDADCNTSVADANDLVFLRKILLYEEEIRSHYSTDLNGDTSVNIIDLVRMKKLSAD